MIIKNEKQYIRYKEAAEISMSILYKLGEAIKPGVTPLEIDNLAGELCKEHHVKASFREVPGYDYNSCISVNDIAVHGIPKDVPLKEGDLVSIDFGIIYKGFNTDHCWTWSVGKPSEENLKLMNAGKEATENAVKLAVAGAYTGDLGHAMESTAKKYGFNILRMFEGHGIGRTLHDEPELPAYGVPGMGDVLKEGMVICVECQVVDGDGDIYTDEDGWSAHVNNGGNSVMYEYMVIVRDGKPEILTDTREWKLIA
jgi:methionyl aminopeptidase